MWRLKAWFWTKVFEFEYRNIDDDVCCCGSDNCDSDWTHSYRSAKEYAVTCRVEEKLKR